MARRKPVPAPTKTTKPRLLVFDLLKIIFIAIIVYDHSQLFLLKSFNSLLFSDGKNFYNIYVNGITGLAVYGMFFVSGAVLEYTYKDRIGSWPEYFAFMKRRAARIYPAFWMSLIFGLVLVLALSNVTIPSVTAHIPEILFEYTGFYIILGESGLINNMGWFIAAIVALYVLFPLVSEFTRRYKIYAILLLMIVGVGVRVALFTHATEIPSGALLWRWFPLCNIFEFGLGIYVIQNGLYPKTENTSPWIMGLVDLSFYVFLFHMIIIFAIVPLLPKVGSDLTGLIAYLLMMAAMLSVCWIFMRIDRALQKRLRNMPI